MSNQSTCVRCGKPCAAGEIMCPECDQWFQEQTQGKNQNFKKVSRPAARPPRQAPQQAPAQSAPYQAPAQQAPAQQTTVQREAREVPAGVTVGANQTICPNCGSVISSISRFCPQCNWDQNQTPAAPVRNAPVSERPVQNGPVQNGPVQNGPAQNRPAQSRPVRQAESPVSPPPERAGFGAARKDAPAKPRNKLLIPAVIAVVAVAVIAIVLVLVLGGKPKTDLKETVTMENGDDAANPTFEYVPEEPEESQHGTGTVLAEDRRADLNGVYRDGTSTLTMDGAGGYTLTTENAAGETGVYTYDGTDILLYCRDQNGNPLERTGRVDEEGRLVFEELDCRFTLSGEQGEVALVVACIKCGAAIPGDAQFCPYCGQDQFASVEEAPADITAALRDSAPETGGPTTAELQVSGTSQSSVVTQSGTHDNTAGVLVDGNLETSWQEGVDGDGIDEWVSMNLSGTGYVSCLRLYLGNWRSEDWYRKNNVPKVLEISLDDQTFTVEFPYDRTEHWVEFSEPVRCSTVKLTVKEVYSGSQYDDTCIAEVMIYGYSE